MNGHSLKRVPRYPIRGAAAALNRLLHHVECGVLGRGGGPLAQTPVFILGAPRCGSTLLYQLLVERFDFGYISNIHCKFHGAPSLAERVFGPGGRSGGSSSSYSSDHGRVSGWDAPSECGDYWYRFFRRKPQYVPLSGVRLSSLIDLRRSVRAMGVAMGRPVLFKNLPCALRLEPIREALPESLFMVVNRDWMETAHSILEARMRLYGDYGEWFSVEPPGMDALRKRPAHEQVVEQIHAVHRLIDKERAAASDRFLDVDYDALCRDTGAVLEEIGAFLESKGAALGVRGHVPPSFPKRTSRRIDESVYGNLREYLERAYGRGV